MLVVNIKRNFRIFNFKRTQTQIELHTLYEQITNRLLQESHLIDVQPHRAPNHVNTSNFTNTTPPPGEGLVNLNRDAELAYDTGRELCSPALTHQMSPTTLRVLQLHGPIIMTHHNKRRRAYIYSDVSLCLFVADCTVLTRHWKVETPRKRWRTSLEE